MVGINRIWRIGDNETNGSITNPSNEIVEFDDVTLVQPSAGNAQFTTSARVNVTVDITQLSALKGDINPSQDGVRTYFPTTTCPHSIPTLSRLACLAYPVCQNISSISTMTFFLDAKPKLKPSIQELD